MQSENGNFSKTVSELVEVYRCNGLTGQTEQAEAIYSPFFQKEARPLSNFMITEALVLPHSQKRYKPSSGILIFCLSQNASTFRERYANPHQAHARKPRRVYR